MVLRKIFAATAIALALVFVADAAQAGTLTVSDSGHRTGDGGEFTVSGSGAHYIPPAAAVTIMQPAAANAEFLTFCLEWQEHLGLPGSYYYDVQHEAIGGGFNAGTPGPNGGDLISVATAKLFYAYWTGQLASFDVGATTYNFRYGTAAATAAELADRTSDGAQLQFAIWSLEDESLDTIGLSPKTTDTGNELAAAFLSYANSVTWAALGRGWAASSVGGVRALNPYTADGVNKQSMLVIVPLPTSALMGAALLAAMGLVMYRRRRRLSVG